MSWQSLRRNADVVLVVASLYTLAFVLVWWQVGPWHAVRKVAAPALIVALWMGAAWSLLHKLPDVEHDIKRPGAELVIGFAALMVAVASAVFTYRLEISWLRWAALGWIALPAATLVWLGYDRRSVGLRRSNRRIWLTVLVVVAINVAVGIVGATLLPSGELTTSEAGDLAEQIAGPLDVVLLIATLLVGAALPEEFGFRVYLQPRLACFLPIRWAIVAQALLFNAVHLPQQFIRYGTPLPLALTATVLTPANGLIAGYLWRKSGSLLPLLVLHLFAFARFGL